MFPSFAVFEKGARSACPCTLLSVLQRKFTSRWWPTKFFRERWYLKRCFLRVTSVMTLWIKRFLNPVCHKFFSGLFKVWRIHQHKLTWRNCQLCWYCSHFIIARPSSRDAAALTISNWEFNPRSASNLGGRFWKLPELKRFIGIDFFLLYTFPQ